MARGGKRPGAGRPKGAVQKGTSLDKFNMVLRSQEYSAEMLDVLVDLARNSNSESTRLSAATQILDRAHGKPGQSKSPDAEKGQLEYAKIFGAFIQSPYMNYDAPLVGSRYDIEDD